MNRKELNMSKNTNNNQTVDEKKGKRTGLTILGYVLVIVALLTVLPVVHSTDIWLSYISFGHRPYRKYFKERQRGIFKDY